MIEPEEENVLPLKPPATKNLMLKRLGLISGILLAAGSAFGQPKAGDSVPGQLLVQSRLGANSSPVARTLAVNGAGVQKESLQIRVHALTVPGPAIYRVHQALPATGLLTVEELEL